MDFPTEIFGDAMRRLAASRLLSVYGTERKIVRDGGALSHGFLFFLDRKMEKRERSGNRRFYTTIHASFKNY